MLLILLPKRAGIPRTGLSATPGYPARPLTSAVSLLLLHTVQQLLVRVQELHVAGLGLFPESTTQGQKTVIACPSTT